MVSRIYYMSEVQTIIMSCPDIDLDRKEARYIANST